MAGGAVAGFSPVSGFSRKIVPSMPSGSPDGALVLGAQRAALVVRVAGAGRLRGARLAWPKSWPRKLAPSPAEA